MHIPTKFCIWFRGFVDSPWNLFPRPISLGEIMGLMNYYYYYYSITFIFPFPPLHPDLLTESYLSCSRFHFPFFRKHNSLPMTNVRPSHLIHHPCPSPLVWLSVTGWSPLRKDSSLQGRLPTSCPRVQHRQQAFTKNGSVAVRPGGERGRSCPYLAVHLTQLTFLRASWTF